MNRAEMAVKIAELHRQAVERRKEEFIEEIMNHVYCHDSDREHIKKLIDRSFIEGINAYIETELQIITALEEEGEL